MSKISVTSLRPRSLLRRTGLPVKAFLMLVARVAALLPAPGRGRPWSLLLDNRVLPAAAWRTKLTHRQLADLSGIGVATVHRVIDRIAPLVAQLLEPPDNHRSDLWAVDGTLIPVEEYKQSARSKNHRRSVNVQLVFRVRDRRVVAVGNAWPGNRNDIVVFRATMAGRVAGHRLTIGDDAYRSAPEVVTSRNKNKAFAKRRGRAEHGLARLKDYRVLRRHRRRGDTINDTIRAVAVLHNLKIDYA
ncbi:transposase family protein [Streptomyces acidiscabies]|uniref:transposase n=1 Tax=Streptomyces acidiscabies TaxID=42234 RepID=UPI0030CB0E8F